MTAVADAEATEALVTVATFREDGGVPGTLMISISDPSGSTITPVTRESGRVVAPLPPGGNAGSSLRVPVCPAAGVKHTKGKRSVNPNAIKGHIGARACFSILLQLNVYKRFCADCICKNMDFADFKKIIEKNFLFSVQKQVVLLRNAADQLKHFRHGCFFQELTIQAGGTSGGSHFRGA
jgi:hypothetical protein